MRTVGDDVGHVLDAVIEATHACFANELVS